VIVLVDTSVWVDFFNGEESIEAKTLAHLIEDRQPVATCGVVVAEFFQGLRKQRSLVELRRYFLELDYLKPREPDSYLAAADLFRALREKGVTIRSTIDCLIAQMASENGALLLAKDRDMKQILTSGLCHTQAAPLVS